MLALHRARQGFVRARTAQANQIRGLLAEYGVVIPKGISHIAKRLPEILEDGENDLKSLDRHIEELEAQIQRRHRDDATSRKPAQIPGIGPITASALAASIGDAKQFKGGRQLAAWLGLVPKQHSSGGKPLLLRISKRGDTYLRTLLIHGARAVIRCARYKTDYPESWLASLIDRRHKNVAAVALANKNVRIVWALLAHDRRYQSGYSPLPSVAVA